MLLEQPHQTTFQTHAATAHDTGAVVVSSRLPHRPRTAASAASPHTADHAQMTGAYVDITAHASGIMGDSNVVANLASQPPPSSAPGQKRPRSESADSGALPSSAEQQPKKQAIEGEHIVELPISLSPPILHRPRPAAIALTLTDGRLSPSSSDTLTLFNPSTRTRCSPDSLLPIISPFSPSLYPSPAAVPELGFQSVSLASFAPIVSPQAFLDSHTLTFKPHTLPMPSLIGELESEITLQQPPHQRTISSNHLRIQLPVPAPSLPPLSRRRRRFKLKPPPSPAPRMAISWEHGSDLVENKMLLVCRQQQTQDDKGSKLDDDAECAWFDDAEGDAGEESLTSDLAFDLHADAAFFNSPTYTSSNPFAHTEGSAGGSWRFERAFRNHKLVGAGTFFEVFRCEAVEPVRCSKDDATVTVAATSAPPRRQVYAVKKSMRSFRSTHDRDCFLRETRMLQRINEPHTPASSAPPPPTRNPHLIRWHASWQECGYFFEQLEYCLYNLDELVHVMMETKVDPAHDPLAQYARFIPCANDEPITTAASTQPLQSYFHAHMLRLFLSFCAQLGLALYSIHKQFGMVHLDVKPENVLLERRGKNLLLSDFGHAAIIGEHENHHAVGGEHGEVSSDEEEWLVEGDHEYMAPELLNQMSTDTPAPNSGEIEHSPIVTFQQLLDSSTNAAAVLREQDGSSTSTEKQSLPRNQSGSTRVSFAVDMFSFGLMLFELVSNCELPKSGYLWQRLRQGGVAEYLPSFADTDTNSEQEPGITPWMAGVIINLLSPQPESRMTAAQLLVVVESKLRSLGWIDSSSHSLSASASMIDIDNRAAILACDWSKSLPSCLALPPLSTLNLSSLLERAGDMRAAWATPTPTPGASPLPLSLMQAPSPLLLRQQSTPSPLPSSLPFKLGPRGSPLPAGNDWARRQVSRGVPMTPDTQNGLRPHHKRSRSMGLASSVPMHARTLSAAPNCATPSLLRARGRSRHPGGSPGPPLHRSTHSRSYSNLQQLVTAKQLQGRTTDASPPFSPPLIASQQTHPQFPNSSSFGATSLASSTTASLAHSRDSSLNTALMPLQPPPRPVLPPAMSLRAAHIPLSPFKLNSPAKKIFINALPASDTNAKSLSNRSDQNPTNAPSQALVLFSRPHVAPPPPTFIPPTPTASINAPTPPVLPHALPLLNRSHSFFDFSLSPGSTPPAPCNEGEVEGIGDEQDSRPAPNGGTNSSNTSHRALFANLPLSSNQHATAFSVLSSTALTPSATVTVAPTTAPSAPPSCPTVLSCFHTASRVIPQTVASETA